jgi:DNA-binding CsgD family transcriptional regulator
MFLLPPRLRDLIGKKDKGRSARAFFQDDRLARKVRELAASQRRAEQEVYDDIIESGMKALGDKNRYEEIWTLLSRREQEVTALICLGYRSYEIASTLGISYETVRSHSKHVYAKFGLNRKALRLTLAGWDFDSWWANHQP